MPPETILDSSGPANESVVNATSATFTFSSEAGATFECRLTKQGQTAGTFGPCSDTKTHTVSGLGSGSYTFEVRATDASLNTDPTPASRTWTVDVTAPTIKNWTPRGTGIKPTAKPTVVFSEAMNEALLERSVAGKPTTFFLKQGSVKIAATVTYVDTATGQHKAVLTPSKPLARGTTYTATVTTAAKDLAGNALRVVKTWRFTVA